MIALKKTNVLLALAALSAVTCAMLPMLFGAVAGDAPRVAYITFDDGPTLNTPNIINTLGKYNAKATFFVLEERIVLYPDYIKQIINSGNAIGLHGVSHSLAIYSSPLSPLNEMEKTNKSLEALTGRRSMLVRVPYGSSGHLSEEQGKNLESKGYKLWDWNVDPRDSVGHIVPENVFRNMCRDLDRCEKTPVILFHDRKSTAQLLPSVLEYLTERGFKLLPLSEKMIPQNSLGLK